MKKALLCIGMALLLGVTGCGKAETQTQEQPQKTQQQIKTETIDNCIQHMSTEEMVGQMLMMDFRKNADDSDMTVLSKDAAKQIADYHLGGVIVFAENLDTTEQTKKLLEDMQKNAQIPLLIGVDEEGGMVSRLDKSQIPHTTIPNAMDMAEDTTQAEQAGNDIGRVLYDLGIHLDFAPVADIFTNPENTVIGKRAYGTEPQIVADMATAFLHGLQKHGISGTAKHFPGHGDTDTDSHYGMAMTNKNIEQMQQTEWIPFQQLIDENIDMVMVGHVMMPNVTTDNLPASLSKQAVNLIRTQLHFDGIVITDAMNMGAIAEYYDSGTAAVMAVQAGVDIVLMPMDLDAAYTAILHAIEKGEIQKSQIEQSVRKILSLKYEKGMQI